MPNQYQSFCFLRFPCGQWRDPRVVLQYFTFRSALPMMCWCALSFTGVKDTLVSLNSLRFFRAFGKVKAFRKVRNRSHPNESASFSFAADQHRDCSLQLPLLRQPPSVGFPAWQGKTQKMQPENQARNQKNTKTLIPYPLIQIDEPPAFTFHFNAVTYLSKACPRPTRLLNRT